jgi:hypothetical protein
MRSLAVLALVVMLAEIAHAPASAVDVDQQLLLYGPCCLYAVMFSDNARAVTPNFLPEVLGGLWRRRLGGRRT